MKLMAIRLIENKEPVMIIGGHRKQWDDLDLFWRIDECTDPNQCEYIDFNVDDKSMCFMWQRKLDKQDESDDYSLLSDASLGEEFNNEVGDVFESNEGWKPVDIPLELIYPGISE